MNKIGYIICETAASEPIKPVIVDQKSNRVVLESILIDTDTKNRNGRYYAASELDPELTCARTKELLSTGNFKGEDGHPMSKDIVRQQTIDPKSCSIKFLKFWKEGKNVKGYVTGTQNQLGQDFDNDIRAGELPSYSLRALGTIENTSRGAEVKNVKLITFDRVN